MLKILRIGEHAIHDSSFKIDRPCGHPVYLLLLVKTASSFWVDDKWVSVSPDTAFIFKPGQKHLYRAENNVYIDDWMHIQSEQSLLNTAFPYGKPIPLQNPENYYSLFHLICTEFYETAPHRSTVLHHLTMSMLEKINDLCNLREHSALYYDLVNLRTQIYNHPGYPWNIKEIANKLKISQGYFYSVYKQTFHATCIGDVIQSRMEYAMDLLSATEKSVYEISELCGYRYTAHFLRQFKSHLQMTPLEYRKSHRQT